jgi:hypothetical protein
VHLVVELVTGTPELPRLGTVVTGTVVTGTAELPRLGTLVRGSGTAEVGLPRAPDFFVGVKSGGGGCLGILAGFFAE